ncbi:metallophosphoesterase family protein [Acetobacter orleanensis]|uniref:Exonuclease n=1 Tax=Acetobacter orleanensis TaxID=104099 RepID=A0A4Y3TS06_9PROT|nr:DNA repair exonuclease [Acetobacter orleanensis]KXV66404.1 DNA repair exonuclease [Acetobacter orleanensis]PCD78749.1 DNA repair exonuclease [Acetobacter orleanensis]GAN67934.1 DNA repair exonuclease [Acetobacter orleanensis JCM 7639]GBR29490.1 DNA repair exonuclease [Acetobacter orleanensis NRIC 0473]GEB83790.1 exonuclease [Acetobacter orleanensis]
MKFIHTSDWQIGRTFRFADDDTLGALQAERLEVIRRLGSLARQEGVTHVLVAGDVYEHETPGDRTLHQPVERMREFADVQWHLIPGNHDADQPEGVWARLTRSGLPENVTLHREPGPVLLDGAHQAWLLPAVLKRRHVLTDLTAYMDEAETPPDALRIGLAHGSVVGFGGEAESEHNPVAVDRARRAGLAYLGLGDWHGFCRIDARTFYSGTPETDRFTTGGGGGGEAVVVTLPGVRAEPEITRHRTGRYIWKKLNDVVLTSGQDVQALEARIRSIAPDNPGAVLVWAAVSGLLSVEDMALYENTVLKRLSGAVACLRLTGAPYLSAGLDDLDRFGAGGAVRAAAEQLLARSEAGGAEGQLASEALQRLFLFWQERGAQAG